MIFIKIQLKVIRSSLASKPIKRLRFSPHADPINLIMSTFLPSIATSSQSQSHQNNNNKDAALRRIETQSSATNIDAYDYLSRYNSNSALGTSSAAAVF